MATLKDIKKRIHSVKNTKKVTKAMQMIAAARLRRAQEAALGARAYTQHVRELATRIARCGAGDVHPFLQVREPVRRVEFLVFTSDRGLCGGFNENLVRQLHVTWTDYVLRGVEVQCTVVGRKGIGGLRVRNRPMRESIAGFYDPLDIARVRELAVGLADRFLQAEVDRVVLVYNRFKSAMSQDITFEPLLPMITDADAGQFDTAYLFEPSPEAVVRGLVEGALTARLYQACLESIAGELGARMVAMDNATKNANDMIDHLTMQFNRARQASITRELLDIVNGAESLKG